MTRSATFSCSAKVPRLAQQAVDQRGLAVVDVGDDGDVSDLAGHAEAFGFLIRRARAPRAPTSAGLSRRPAISSPPPTWALPRKAPRRGRRRERRRVVEVDAGAARRRGIARVFVSRGRPAARRRRAHRRAGGGVERRFVERRRVCASVRHRGRYRARRCAVRRSASKWAPQPSASPMSSAERTDVGALAASDIDRPESASPSTTRSNES